MITGRTLAQGASCESKMSPDFFRAASVCHISREDYAALGLVEGRNVLLSSENGRVVLSPLIDEGLRRGMVFVPMGPWANALVGPDTGGCGTPHFKGLQVEVEATGSPVPAVRELFSDLERGVV